MIVWAPYQLITLILQVLGPSVIRIPALHQKLSWSLKTRTAFPRRLRIQVSHKHALRLHIFIPWVKPCAIATLAWGLLITRWGSFPCVSLPVLLFELTACVGLSTGGAADAFTTGTPCCHLWDGILVCWDLGNEILKWIVVGVWWGLGSLFCRYVLLFIYVLFFLKNS